MATNYKQPGEVLTFAAPYAVASGAGALVGALFGVALTTLENAAEGEFKLTGVWSLKCASGSTFAVGADVYWDNSAKQCTSTSSGNSLIGAATAVKSGGSVVVTVRLNGTTVS